MGSINYIPLRTTSQYSLLEGAMQIESIVNKAINHKIPAIGLTDRNNLFGALEFSEKLIEKGIQPIIGCNLSFYNQKMDGSIVCLAKNEEGYKNLIRLSSELFLSNDDEKLKLSKLSDFNEGLILLSGGYGGLINNYLKFGLKKDALELTHKLKKIFQDRLYIEIQRMGKDDFEIDLLDISNDLNLPIVASNTIFFESKDRFTSHDALIAIKESTTVNNSNRETLTNEFYFKSPEEMINLFEDMPDAINNSLEIAHRTAFKVSKSDPRLPRFSGLDSQGETDELVHQAKEGLKVKIQENNISNEEIYWDRLKTELDIIISMNFPGYFLIVADFIKWSKSKNIPVGPGRGSGAGSLVAWALTITDLDPIKFNLIFERFLNPERISLPDFDIDFCQDRREEVIEYVQDKYGKDSVAQIITFGSLQSRAVLRDVGRVLGLPYGQVDRICKLVPNNPANPTTLSEAIDGDIRIREERDNDDDIASMLKIGLELEGLYRNASTHAAGLVIGDEPLQNIVPLYRDPRSEMPVTQFNMKWVEAAGLVKFDFLGLKTLTVIDKAINLIKQKKDIDIDISKIPLDDKATYELLGTGNTIGIFQLESSGMQDVLRNMQPDCFEDIIALVALYRPGPMDNIPKYIACKKGDDKPDYMDDSLEKILKETYGVIIYQEQVMQTAQILSNYSLGEADILRRAMGKKIKSEMDAQKERFISGAIKNGINEKKADYIFEQVAVFAGYGFNKSHAAAYALIAYQTAYLKTHFPEFFITASMSLEKDNTDKLSVFVNDAKKMGIKILPPDINKSKMDFDVEENDIRYGLGAIKNTSQKDMIQINDEVHQNGNFKDLYDFAQRLDASVLSKKNLEFLAYSGTFDAIENNRNKVYQSINILSSISNAAMEKNSNNQDYLFDDEFENFSHIPLPEVDNWTNSESLEKEFTAIGFYLSGHPLNEYEQIIKDKKIKYYSDINSSETKYKIAGTISYVKERKSQRGRNFAFVGLTDENNQFEITLFSDILFKVRNFLIPGLSIIAEVETQRNDNNLRLLTIDLFPLEELMKKNINVLKVYVNNPETILKIRDRVEDKGNSKILVQILMNGEDKYQTELKLGNNFIVNPSIKASIKEIEGVLKIEEV
ncbi:MAG: DNA polymerase III subunit alpha [Pseudomonadota bacterium]|jgi:DNA polymerase-3 subunit alpha|nr:DNA polymerase III subunit alpha [Pseudomonadota bacterium]MED5273293.1 DNA polymerase III subunit alpha [Pseudomonadota bacterium]MED5484157.1 DNA polymerase III subunit alpha [Pseudomonadota bacterium]|tara:strand:- start:1014 stop:4379 length:3366 start_codon:yes stop_codon:yes gene_type:complete